MHFDFTATPIFNKAAIRFAAVDIYPQKEIRLHLNTYKPPYRSPQLTVRTTGVQFTASTSKPYALDSQNYVTGGVAVGAGPSTVAKIVMDGWIDTSVANDGSGNMIPQTTVKTQIGTVFNLTDAELIPYYIEGRMNASSQDRRAQHPLWFRDPYGHVFSNPRIMGYTANFIEAAPGRCSFTMVLVV